MADAFVTSDVTADTCRRRMLMESWLASAAPDGSREPVHYADKKDFIKSVKV